jgi:MFS family permease
MTFDGWSTLKYRDFALVCGARFAVTLALQITGVAISWYIYDVTGSAFALGYLGLAGFLPAVVLVLVTGTVADRFDRKRILFASDLVLTLTALALFWLVAAGYGTVWPIYLIIVCVSASRAFHNPAAQAIIPALVPQDELAKSIAFASGSFQAAQILGPALGGLLYAVSPVLPFIVAGALYAGSAMASLSIRHRSDTAAGSKAPITINSVLAGFDFTLKKPVVLGAMSLDTFVVMLGGVVVLLPIFAKDILQVGPVGLGLLRAAPAVGALMMAAWLANNDFVQRKAGARLFQTVAVYGAATLCFGLSGTLWLSLLCLVVVGASDMISVVIRHTMVQSETPDDLRGRVSAVNALFISSSSELGQLRAGVFAGFIGAAPAVVIGGAMVVGLSYLWPLLFQGLRDRDHLVEDEVGGARHARA